MDSEQLQRASEQLRRASETATGELARRLDDEAAELETAASSTQGPGRDEISRHLTTLRDAAMDAEAETAAHVEEALEALREYRTRAGWA
jgi:hypothetical protein